MGMAMIDCPDCKGKVPDNATACPHCAVGARKLHQCPKCETMNTETGYPVWIFAVAILLFPIGTLAFNAGKKKMRCASCSDCWRPADERKWWTYAHKAHPFGKEFAWVALILCIPIFPAAPPIVAMSYLLGRLIWSLKHER